MYNSEGFKLLRSIAEDFGHEIYLKSLNDSEFTQLLRNIRSVQTDIEIAPDLLTLRTAAFCLRVAVNRFYAESSPRKRAEYEKKFVKLTNLLV